MKKLVSSALFRNCVSLFDKSNNNAENSKDRNILLGSVPRFRNRSELYQNLLKQVGDEPISYLEFGVWEGKSFREWVSGNKHPQSRFTGFDTFTGLPEDWMPEFPAGAFSTAGAVPRLDDPRAEFVPGLFQDTLYEFLDKHPPANSRIVLHLDADLYSSTLFVLATMDRFLRPGTILIFDEFNSLNHEYQAWYDYRRSFGHQWKGLGQVGDDALQAAIMMVG